MFCTKCGKKNEDNANFCLYCGLPIRTAESEDKKSDADNAVETTENNLKSVGNIKKVIDAIIVRKGKGDPLLVINIRKKLVLKGINPAQYTHQTIDDPIILKKLMDLAKDLGFMV